jgi:hypothetical protein
MNSSLKFKREKVSSLMGHTEVRYTEEGTAGDVPESAFQIIADPMGVRFRGGPSTHLSSSDDLELFAATVGAAFHDHVALKPKLAKNLSGH